MLGSSGGAQDPRTGGRYSIALGAYAYAYAWNLRSHKVCGMVSQPGQAEEKQELSGMGTPGSSGGLYPGI